MSEKRERKPERNPMCFSPKSGLVYFALTICVVCVVGSLYDMFYYDSRSARINDYNKYVSLWNANLSDSFEKETFSYSVDNIHNGLSVHVIDYTSSNNTSYLPVYDSCKEQNDPDNGCLVSKSIIFNDIISLTKDTTMTIYTNNNAFTLNVPITKLYSFSIRDLNCHFESGLCPYACEARNGTWENDHCYIAYQLSNINLRVRNVNNTYILDTNEYEPYESTHGSGLNYIDNSFNIFEYKAESSSVSITLMHAYDPKVLASLYTYGCSSLENQSQCFGPTFGFHVVHTLLPLCLSLFFTIIVVVILIVMKKKSHKANTNDNTNVEQQNLV